MSGTDLKHRLAAILAADVAGDSRLYVRCAWTRFVARVGAVTPAAVCQCRRTSLRACGLSTEKAACVKDLATGTCGGLCILRNGQFHSPSACRCFAASALS